MKIGILLVCTGRYIQFFEKLYRSLQKFYLLDHQKKIYLFTDSDEEFPSDVCVTKIERKGFPGDTLYRYHYFLKIKEQLQEETDVLFYMDIDSLVVFPIDEAVIPSKEKPLVGVLHPGFYNINNGTPETNSRSTAFIDPNEKRYGYVCGGHQGGLTKQYLEACEAIKKNIDIDDSRNVMAIWNDESHWNRHYVSNQAMFMILAPSYMFPEGWYQRSNLRELTPKILALNKDHHKIRKPL